MQEAFDKFDVSNISITLMDNISGPFNLEIGYVGLELMEQPFREKFAYEMYKLPHRSYIGSYF